MSWLNMVQIQRNFNDIAGLSQNNYSAKYEMLSLDTLVSFKASVIMFEVIHILVESKNQMLLLASMCMGVYVCLSMLNQ